MSTIIDSHNVNVLDHILPIEKYHSLLQKKEYKIKTYIWQHHVHEKTKP
jgi:hypothetical protein